MIIIIRNQKHTLLIIFQNTFDQCFFSALFLASLSTAPSRPKSSSVAMRNEEGKSHHAMKPKHNLPAASTGKSVVNGTQNSIKLKGDRTKAVSEKKDPSK